MGDEYEEEGHPDYLPVGDVLDEIGAVIRDADMIKPIKKAKRIWRVRPHRELKKPIKETEFTSPPVEKATKPNRMSPAGIAMFYGAEDFDTASCEIVDPGKEKGKKVTGGCFATLVELRILDLVDIPLIPSFFDEKKTKSRNDLLFLSRFARDLAGPINECPDIKRLLNISGG